MIPIVEIGKSGGCGRDTDEALIAPHLRRQAAIRAVVLPGRVGEVYFSGGGSMPASSRDQRRLYGDLAWTWPIISCRENYVQEAREFCHLIQEHARIEVKTLLHLGCGGGHLDFTLKERLEITGVDISADMLALAGRLNPEVTYCPGDMRSVRLDRTFDAVMIADSIAYMLTVEDLRAAFETAFVHLKPGGVFCTYAEVTVESWQQNRTECSTHARGDVEIVFVENCYDPDPSDTTYENVFVYLIRRGGRLEIETDRHLGGIFGLETWHRSLRAVGFEVQQGTSFDEEISTFVCLKPL